ncbi:MAG: AtpZ/AtpI family protein [Candidatus Roizmanbacteria bacterium]
MIAQSNSKIDINGDIVSLVKNEKKLPKKIVHSNYISEVGIYVAMPLLVLLGIGVYLDNAFHLKPVCTFGGIILGTISTFYNLFRMVTNDRSKT